MAGDYSEKPSRTIRDQSLLVSGCSSKRTWRDILSSSSSSSSESSNYSLNDLEVLSDERAMPTAGDDEKPSRSIRDQSLLVSSRCSDKGTRRDTPSSSSSSSSESSKFSLNDLEVLLTEVLQRLPTAKSAFLCKCVCNNWYSLISTPFFTRRFITHHLKHQYKQNPYAAVINCWAEYNTYELRTLSDEPMFKSCGFELNYFPERNGSVMVSAIFNDLMLCFVSKSEWMHYYICNPFTMQWVPLPPLHLAGRAVRYRVGFVCEPYYFEDSQGECTINCRYRFRVVLISKSTESQLLVRTFCSETQKWYRSVLEGSEYGCISAVVAYNGKLHWYNSKNISAYDPFNPELSTFINCSSIQFTEFSARRIGVCQGFLRLMELVDSGTSHTLAIWKLEDYNKGEWSLGDKFSLDAMIPESSWVQKMLCYCELELLGLDPCDGHIVYMLTGTSVIVCNTKTKELKIAGKIQMPVGCYFYSHDNVFHIELPLWPTPIGTPVEISP